MGKQLFLILQSLPGNALSVALYILFLIRTEQGIAKIEGIFYGIKFVHKVLQMVDPTMNLIVKEMLEVAKRQCNGHS